MPNQLSILGIIHTAISVAALFPAFYSLIRYGVIKPASRSGYFYIYLTIVACVTSLPLMKTGHFTLGHILAILILLLLVLSYYSERIFGTKGLYVQTFAVSSTLFFSLIPAIVETLTRLPVSNPIASRPDEPILQIALLSTLVLYIGGVIFQLLAIRRYKGLTAK